MGKFCIRAKWLTMPELMSVFYSISEYEINSIPPPGRDVVHRSVSSSIDFGGTVGPRFTTQK